MGFNSGFKGLNCSVMILKSCNREQIQVQAGSSPYSVCKLVSSYVIRKDLAQIGFVKRVVSGDIVVVFHCAVTP